MKILLSVALIIMSFPTFAAQSDPFDTSVKSDASASSSEIDELKREFRDFKTSMILSNLENAKVADKNGEVENSLGIRYLTDKIESFLEASGKYYVRISGPENNPRYIELSKEVYFEVKSQYNTIDTELGALTSLDGGK